MLLCLHLVANTLSRPEPSRHHSRGPFVNAVEPCAGAKLDPASGRPAIDMMEAAESRVRPRGKSRGHRDSDHALGVPGQSAGKACSSSPGAAEGAWNRTHSTAASSGDATATRVGVCASCECNSKLRIWDRNCAARARREGDHGPDQRW
jgi:hypothetical protein